MPRKKYSCDFETTTDPNDCRVWAYGYMNIDDKTDFKIGTSIDEFMEWVKKVKADLYFHNLKFDGEFIVNWLLKNGWEHNDSGLPNTFKTVISSQAQWYIIDICYGYKGKTKLHTVIYDSLKKLPFKVSQIAKSFKLPMAKGEIDYDKPRPIGYIPDDEELDYIKKDIEIVADALKIQFNQGLDRITSGSDSLAGFKATVTSKLFDKLFPTFSIPFDKNFRKAYKGGFTWLNEKYAEKELGEGIVFDVNSLYPSVMYEKPLPIGAPLPYEGKYEYDERYPLYIQHIVCEFEIKENHIPTIQIKKNPRYRQNEYLKSSNGDRVDLWVTSVDLELIQEHYDLYDIEYKSGWKFRQKTGIFNNFIDRWTYVKTHETGAKKQLAKLMLNSLYGKFATNPDVTGKVPYLKDDGSTGFRLGDEEFKDPIYTPMGAFITAWARDKTIRTAQMCYDRIIYCDTDSIHLTGKNIPDSIKDFIDPKALGMWAWEGTFKRAKYLRQKTYVYDMYYNNGEPCTPEEAKETRVKVTCAGMNDAVKETVTFENFEVGFTSPLKLRPKHVDGGVVLVNTDFTIK